MNPWESEHNKPEISTGNIPEGTGNDAFFSSQSPTPPQPGQTGRFVPTGNETPEELKARLTEAEKQLAAEKEKVMMANLKQTQAQAVEAQVEFSLKDIQQKVQRDRRERELEDERAELRTKLKSLEEKLINERETWVHILRNNLQAQPVPQPAPVQYEAPRIREFETTIIDRLNAMEQRWAQEQQLLRREIAERTAAAQPAPAAPPPDTAIRMAKLEAEYRRALTEKTILAQELANLKNAATKMENQGSYLDQIATIVLTLKDAVSTLGQQSGATLEFARNVAKKEEEFMRAKKQIAQLSEAKAQQDAALAQNQTQITGLKADKLRAVQELLKLKQGLTQLRAVNSALERELNRVEAEKREAQKHVKEQAEVIVQLKKDIAANEEKYLTDVSEITRKWEEQKIEMSDLTAELSNIQARHESRVSELNELLRTQSENYQTRINHLSLLQKSSEEKLKLVEAERNELQQKCDVLAVEKNNLETEKDTLTSDKAQLQSELSRLQAEKENLSEHIEKLTSQTQYLQEQKQQLDVAVLELQNKARENMAAIATLNGEVSALNNRNEGLRQEMTRQRAGYEQAFTERNASYQTEMARQKAEFEKQRAEQTAIMQSQAKTAAETENSLKQMLSHETAVSAALARKIERLENATRDFTGRLKWAITGKPPREDEENER